MKMEVRLNRIFERDRDIVKECLALNNRIKPLVLDPFRWVLAANMTFNVVIVEGAHPSLNSGQSLALRANLLLTSKSNTETTL
jgi:hypothetical protein